MIRTNGLGVQARSLCRAISYMMNTRRSDVCAVTCASAGVRGTPRRGRASISAHALVAAARQRLNEAFDLPLREQRSDFFGACPASLTQRIDVARIEPERA